MGLRRERTEKETREREIVKKKEEEAAKVEKESGGAAAAAAVQTPDSSVRTYADVMREQVLAREKERD